MLGSALAPDFVTEGRSLILAGKPGRGKTHLAIAIACRAIQNGFDAFFTTAAALIDDLSAAFRAGELANALPTYTHPAVQVVDEVRYLTYGTDAANMLFHVVNERHRRHRPMIFYDEQPRKSTAPRRRTSPRIVLEQIVEKLLRDQLRALRDSAGARDDGDVTDPGSVPVREARCEWCSDFRECSTKCRVTDVLSEG